MRVCEPQSPATDNATHVNLKKLLIQHGERGKPFAFAGREDIIQQVHDVAKLRKTEILRGQTFVIEGPPGAGKTSLVMETARQLEDRDSGVKAVVCPDTSGEGQTEMFLWQIASALTDVDLRKLIPQAQERSLSAEATLEGLGGLEGGYETEKQNTGTPSLQNLILLANRPVKPMVVAFIDEAQNIEAQTRAAAIAKLFHTQ